MPVDGRKSSGRRCEQARDLRRRRRCARRPTLTGRRSTSRDVEAVTAVVRGGQVGGYPEPGPRGCRIRRRLRRLPGRAARHRHGQRHRHDGGGAEGAGRRLGRRGDHPGAHVRRHAVRGDGGRRAARSSSTSSPRTGRSTPTSSRRRSRRGRARSCPSTSASRWPTWTGSWRSRGATTSSSSRTAPTPTVSAGATRAPAASATSARSATSPRRS